MNTFYELEGTIEDQSGARPFILRILDAAVDTNTRDWFCRVHCPALLERDFDVYGVDGAQAKELSLRYVRIRLQGATVRDKRGRIVHV